MTPNEVRKLGQELTTKRLGVHPWQPIGDWRIAQTIAPELGVSPRAVLAWLAGEYEPSEPTFRLLKMLAQ